MKESHYVTITSLQLKSPLKFFLLSFLAMKIVGQLKKNSACKQYKSRGFWTMHYTMSLWSDMHSLKAFAREGAHLYGMQQSKNVAAEILTYTYPADQLPSWNVAKELLLQHGKALRF